MMVAENNPSKLYMQNQTDIEKGTMEMQDVHQAQDENVSNNSVMNGNGFVKPQDQV